MLFGCGFFFWWINFNILCRFFFIIWCFILILVLLVKFLFNFCCSLEYLVEVLLEEELKLLKNLIKLLKCFLVVGFIGKVKFFFSFVLLREVLFFFWWMLIGYEICLLCVILWLVIRNLFLGLILCKLMLVLFFKCKFVLFFIFV